MAVTGGTGFVGGHPARLPLARDDDVIMISRRVNTRAYRDHRTARNR
jgi:uncharacterized protein YbjT (DUF2867 family)